LANRISPRDYLHQHDPHLTLGGDCGLIKGATAILPSRPPLYLYGPYKREQFATAPSNQAFDRGPAADRSDWRHLVFFRRVTTGPDNFNSVLALAFGVLIPSG
jgi:hypothetical protein